MKRVPTKQQKANQETGKERGTISVRNISLQKWAEFSRAAKADGKYVWAALEDLIEAYLKNR